MGDVPVLKPRESPGFWNASGSSKFDNVAPTGSIATRTAVRPRFHPSRQGHLADTVTGDRARRRNGRPRLRRASLKEVRLTSWRSALQRAVSRHPHAWQHICVDEDGFQSHRLVPSLEKGSATELGRVIGPGGYVPPSTRVNFG